MAFKDPEKKKDWRRAYKARYPERHAQWIRAREQRKKGLPVEPDPWSVAAALSKAIRRDLSTWAHKEDGVYSPVWVKRCVCGEISIARNQRQVRCRICEQQYQSVKARLHAAFDGAQKKNGVYVKRSIERKCGRCGVVYHLQAWHKGSRREVDRDYRCRKCSNTPGWSVDACDTCGRVFYQLGGMPVVYCSDECEATRAPSFRVNGRARPGMNRGRRGRKATISFTYPGVTVKPAKRLHATKII